jgi:hypothetical protein
MEEIIIVVGVVIMASVWIGRSVYKTMTGKNAGCGCPGGCRGWVCTGKNLAETPQEQDAAK